MNKLIQQTNDLFKSSGIPYAICGGFALDIFAGKKLREHGDFDVLIFEEDKRCAVQFLLDKNWTAYGRFMLEGKLLTQHLFHKINNISDSFWDDCKNVWAVQPNNLMVLEKVERLQGEIYTYQSREWLVKDELEFIELEFDTKDGSDYVVQEFPRITRPLDKAILYRDGIPYLAPEIILFYKSDNYLSQSPYAKPKTQEDFKNIVPLLSESSVKWLKEAVNTAYPDGYEWLGGLL